MNPYQVIEDFELALQEYTGAPHVVTVDSCTNALFLAMKMMHADPAGPFYRGAVEIPKHTYPSVPMQIIHAGFKVAFRDEDWSGKYQLIPFHIYDCARRFTSNMFVAGEIQCVSFHWSKILGIQQGGAILHDRGYDYSAWLKSARFDGRGYTYPENLNHIQMLGWHCRMSPETAAQGLVRLSLLPKHNTDLPNPVYPDCSKLKVFQ